MMFFENPDQSKYSYSPSPSGGPGVLWLPMPVYPNGPGSKDVELNDAAWAKLKTLNPGVANFEVLASSQRRPDTATVRIFGMGTGETRIEARRPLHCVAEAAVAVSVFPLVFPTVNLWLASDNQPSVMAQDAARLLREMNALLTPFTGIQFRLGRVDAIKLGIDVTRITGTGFQPNPVHLDAVSQRLRQIPREQGTSGQHNVILVRNFALTHSSVGYAPDQPGDIAIVGENVKLPQTLVSTMAHELGHCLGVPGNHRDETDSRTLMHSAPKGTIITREIAAILRRGAVGR